MKWSIQILIVFTYLNLLGCRDYNSEAYISIANQAIQDLIPQMTDLDEMIKMNDFNTELLKLFLIKTSDTVILKIFDPELHRVDLLEKKLEDYNREINLFAPFKDDLLKRRVLSQNFTYPNLKIELVDENEIHPLKLNQNELGYLYISRILFNENFNKGYLSFYFFCGEACAWGYNIEIQKIDNKWKITEYFSGGIA